MRRESHSFGGDRRFLVGRRLYILLAHVSLVLGGHS